MTILETYRARGLTAVEYCADVGGGRWNAHQRADGKWKVETVCAGDLIRWGIFETEEAARRVAANLNKLAEQHRTKRKK